MQFLRRQFLHLATGAAALPAVSMIARAQAYPTRPVRIIVGFAAGGGADFGARLIGHWLSERLGQQFIVENRPGAASNLAAEAVVRAPPDGYTLFLVTSVNAVNATLYEKLSFNFISDIAPVASIGRVPGVMVVNPSFPAKTVPEFIAYARANPGKINMASAGNGEFGHVFGELFKMMARVDLVHVPYRGAASALTDLLGGQVQVMFSTMPTSIQYIRAGNLQPLAVTNATHSKALPDISAVSEFVPGCEGSAWFGVGAPKNTPTGIVQRLNSEIIAALADPKLTARLADLGAEPMPMTPAEFEKFVAEETEKWGKVVRAANIKAE